MAKKEIWNLSFVDSSKPMDDRWLGGCYVAASSLVEAVTEAYKQNCNPGGNVSAATLEKGQKCKKEYMNRLLLTYKEVDEAIESKG